MKTQKSKVEKIQEELDKLKHRKSVLTKDLDWEIDSLSKELQVQKELEAKQNEEKRNALELKFNKFINETQDRIAERLSKAQEALNEAIEISNETGVPFETEFITNFKTNKYTPYINPLIEQFSEDIVNNFIYDNDYGRSGSGWSSDFWRASSLSC